VAAISVGSVAVDVVPSVKGFAKDLRAKILPQAAQVGAEIGKTISEAITKGIGDPLSGPLDESSRRQRSKAPRQGEEVAGAFASAFKRRLEAAFAALPKAEIDADSSPADRKIAELRARMQELSGKTIGVDLDAGEALAEIAAIKAELETLGRTKNVQVKVDAATAAAQLAGIEAEVDKLDGRTAKVDVDVSGALAGIGLLSASVGALAAIPVGAALGAGILSLVGPLGAAGAGFAGLAAVAVPAVSHIGDALKAQQAAQKAANGTSAQAAAANKKLAQTMAALSPAERRLLGDWQRLTAAFRSWSRALEPDVLPVFSHGLRLLQSQLPYLTPVVRGAARAVDGLISGIGNAARSPFWTQFRTQMTSLVPVAITGLGRSLGNVVTGMAGIVKAFLPYAPALLGWLVRITGEFANWGKNLGASNSFTRFMAYVRQVAPQVTRTLGLIAQALGHVVVSLAGFGPTAVLGIQGLAWVINSMSPGEIQALALAFLAVRTAIVAVRVATAAWTVVQWLLNSALIANPIGLIIVAVAALVAAIVVAYRHSSTFRAIVQGALHAVGVAAMWLWNNAIKPAFNAIVTAVDFVKGHLFVLFGLPVIGPLIFFAVTIIRHFGLIKAAFSALGQAAVWLWQTILHPFFNAFMLVGKIVAAVIITLAILPLVIAFRLLAAVSLWLWHAAIVPAWHAIRAVIGIVMVAVRGYLFLLRLEFHLLATVALWLWHYGIHPAWVGIRATIGLAWSLIKLYLKALQFEFRLVATVARWLWHTVIQPVWSGIRTAILVAWHGIHATLSAMISFIRAVLSATFRWLRDSIVRPVWNTVRGIISSVWNGGIRPVFNALRAGIGRVADSFKTGARAIGVAWDKIRDYTKKPVRFVIDKVINHGILFAWDTVAKWLHLPTSLQIPYLKLPFAQGGIVRYYAAGGMENHVAQVAPAGAMRVWAEPETGGEAYIPLAPAKRDRSTQILGAVADEFGYGLVPFAEGGFWGKVGKVASGLVGKGLHFGKAILDAVASPVKWVAGHLTAPVKALLSKVDGTNFGKASVAVGEKALGWMKDALTKLLGLFQGGGDGHKMVQVAIGELGQGESPPGSNNTKYGRWYGLNPGPWCAMFIDWVAQKALGSKWAKVIPHTASAPGMMAGLPRQSGAPQPGDIGGIPGQHVFLVEKTTGSTVHTIEGNHSSVVQRNTRPRGLPYFHPNYKEGGALSLSGAITGESAPAYYTWFNDYRTASGRRRWNTIASSYLPLGSAIKVEGPRGTSVGMVDDLGPARFVYARHPGQAVFDLSPGIMRAVHGSLNNFRGRWQLVKVGSGRTLYGKRLRGYDDGGWLPPGPSLVYNGTGSPEAVFSPGQLETLLDGTSGGGAREYHAHFDAMTQAAYETQIRTAFHSMEVSAAHRERVGRRR
jgi:hypothetical protein